MLEWNDLNVILAVGRAGSLSGAARHLGVNHSTVFRRVGAIEQRAGVRFFDRLPGGYRLTEAGEAAVACAERIESQVLELDREILGQDMRVQGHVRVTAMEGLAALVLPGMLADLSRAHPGLVIELVGTVATLDLSRREAEVAIRATRKPPEAAFGRKIGRFRFGIYGSREYLQSRRDVPVKDLDWCVLRATGTWMVPLLWKKLQDLEERTVMQSTSILSMAEAVAAGLGVTLLPVYHGDPDPRLVRVGDLIDELTMDLWLLTHPDLRHTARVRVVMDDLHEKLSARRELFEGGG